MAPLELEGNTLGEKHQHYNKLVDDALKSNQELQPLDYNGDNDIQNLIKIEIACKTKNVDYILDILKSENDLYVAKAIKRSSWIVADPQYSHIVNPDYLYTKLYPQMTLRSFNRFMLHIRLHLRDEKRVESFYAYIKVKDLKLAHKWLQHCSIPFAEKEVKKALEDCMSDIKDKTLKRLHRKSFTLYEPTLTNPSYYFYDSRYASSVLKRFPEAVLDFLENRKEFFFYRFGRKSTEMLMKKYPQRILNNIDIYGKYLHIATFAKHLKYIEDIEGFLLKHVKNIKLDCLYSRDRMYHFITHMPKQSRFEFVKKVFIDKDASNENSLYKAITDRVESQKRKRKNIHMYAWYRFAPFEIAYKDLSKMIWAEHIPLLRTCMLQVILSSAGRDITNTKKVLQYYHDRHFNEAFKFKNRFINSFLSNVKTHTLDDHSWSLLCKLFHSMEVYIESQNNVQPCIKAIIIRNAIRNEPVPDIVENKFVFDTLKMAQNYLKTVDDREALFKYLMNYISVRSQVLNLKDETDFCGAVTMCEYFLQLIKDWGKELHDYPHVLARVKELVKINNENNWGQNLTRLYNIKKSWRKLMFEDSIIIMQNELVCINALKHDPSLLSRYENKILQMHFNDTTSFKNMLRKIRIYWPYTLAEEYKHLYLANLNQQPTHKSFVEGLCVLSTKEQINELLNKHIPSDTKINWNETAELKLSLCKQVVKNVHKARPLPTVEVILQYAKGDYLQFAVPSLSAVLSQLSPVKTQSIIPVLLQAPISLKKFGLRSAIHKLEIEEITPLLIEIWNSTKNTSIRTVIFKHILQLLLKEYQASHQNATWSLLSKLIDNLKHRDSKFIFVKLGEFYKIPINVRPYFYMKSLAILNSLPPKQRCKNTIDNMQYSAMDYVEYFNVEFFIKNLIDDFNIFHKKQDRYDNKDRLIAGFILAAKDEGTQIDRYEKILDVILEMFLPQWESNNVGKEWVNNILEKMFTSLETNTFEKGMAIPQRVFEKVLVRLETILPVQKNYVYITMWKLATAFIKVLKENEQVLIDFKRTEKMDEEAKTKMYDAVHSKTAPSFAKLCVQYLKEDILRFGNSIYLLLAEALKKLFHNYLPGTMYQTSQVLFYLKCLLQCGYDTELYLLGEYVFTYETQHSYRFEDKEKEISKEIYDIVLLNCPDGAKIHFNDAFKSLALSLEN